MKKQSAGIIVYRKNNDQVEVLLVHPGGPFWAKKDFWSIPKGELSEDETHLDAAKREFKEELGVAPPEGKLIELGSSKQSTGKTEYIWAIEGDLDIAQFSYEAIVEMEWPPKSGKTQKFPENDRAEWFNLSTAKQKLFKDQKIFIDRLANYLHISTEADEIPTPPSQSSLF